MTLIALECKNCGAKVQIDDSRERAFCDHCGTQFILPWTVTQKMKMDESEKIIPLLELAESDYNVRNYHKCIERCERAIEIDGKNSRAWKLKGCAEECIKKGSGHYSLEKALEYSDGISHYDYPISNNEQVSQEHDMQSSVSTESIARSEVGKNRSIKLKVDAVRAAKLLMQDVFAVYLDNKCILKIHGKEIKEVNIEPGMHYISIKHGSHLKKWEQRIIVHDNDFILTIVKRGDGMDYSLKEDS